MGLKSSILNQKNIITKSFDKKCNKTLKSYKIVQQVKINILINIYIEW